MSATRRRAIVHADVDPSLIDGSAVWLVSMVELLARADCDVTLLLRDRRQADLPLLEPLRDLPAVRIAEPSGRGRSPGRPRCRARRDAAIVRLRQLDTEVRADLIVIRGLQVATRLAREPQFHGRLWVYLTDIPQSVVDLDAASVASLGEIAEGIAGPPLPDRGTPVVPGIGRGGHGGADRDPPSGGAGGPDAAGARRALRATRTGPCAWSTRASSRRSGRPWR